MTSLAHQNVEELGGPRSVLVRQKQDHARLEVLLMELIGSAPGAAQDRTLRRIARLVFPHAFAEESVLWPVLRRTLPDGEELTLRVEQEHQEINELWTGLDGSPTDEERARLLRRLVDLLRADVRDEEDALLPRLQDAVSVHELRRLGTRWEAVRRTAPTRPHPVVARRPPGNALAALPLTVLDRARDGIDAWAGRMPSVAPRSGHVDAALAGLTRAVERQRPFRRGEHPTTARDGRPS